MSDEVKLMQLESQLRSIQSQLGQFIKKKSITPATGSVISSDENGLVAGARDLQPCDIPQLPMSKIQGLESLLSGMSTPTTVLEQTSDPDVSERMDTLFQVVQEFKKRVSEMDGYDHVNPPARLPILESQMNQLSIQVSELKNTVDHIPRTVTIPNYAEQIRELNETISNLVGQVTRQAQEINVLKAELGKKANMNQVTPGVYTKLAVTREGTISGWEPLTEKDLPQLEIQNIKDLQIQLNAKATNEFVTNLANTVATLMQQVSSSSSRGYINEDLMRKLVAEATTEIREQITSLTISLQRYQQDTDKKIVALASSTVVHDPKRLMQGFGGSTE